MIENETPMESAVAAGADENTGVSSSSSSEAKWFDLYPRRELIDASFEGYKLTLDSFAQYKLALAADSPVDTYNFIESSESQVKYVLFQHLKLFGFQNLLVVNHFRDSDVYYFDVNRRLVKLLYTDALSTLNTPRYAQPTTLQLPLVDSNERTNATMKFVRPNVAVVFDGYSQLHVCELTTSTSEAETWRLGFSWHVPDTNRPGVLKDAVLSADGQLHVVLVFIDEVTDSTRPNKFDTMVSWLQFEATPSGEMAEWVWKRTRKINCFNSIPDYIGKFYSKRYLFSGI